MDTLGSLLRDQQELSIWISNFWVNTQKVGSAKSTAGYLTARKRKLEEYWDTFIARHRAIMNHKGGENTQYAKNDVFNATDAIFFENLGHIEDKLHTINTNVNTSKPEFAIGRHCTGHAQSKLAALEKIKLPTFDGEWLDWPNFKSLFESLVHSDPDVAKTLKLQHLKFHLSGEAAALIENVPISDEGYDGAWQDLLNTYENERLLLFRYMRALIDCAPASKSSASELKRITTAVKRCRRAFTALNRPVQHWSDWFLFLTTEKLDSTTKMFWQTSLPDGKAVPTFDQLLSFLNNRIQALTGTFPMSGAPVKEIAPKFNKPSSNSSKRTAIHHASTSTKPKSKFICPLCQKGHSLGYCDKFKGMSAHERIEQVKLLRACFNCLNPNHNVNNCSSSGACRVADCHRRHHTMLHSSEMHPITPSAGPIAEVTNKTVLTTHVNAQAVLLATARVRLQNEIGDHIVIRALLDHAAESSFISEWAAQRLKVKRKHASILTSGLQGTATGQVKSQAIVNVRTVENPAFNLAVTMLILPSLSKRLPSVSIENRRWRHLESLDLADPDYLIPGRIDAILGADVYGAIVKGAVKHHSPAEPTAVHTVFGWVIFGPTGCRPSSQAQRSQPVLHCALDHLSSQLQRFWITEATSAQVPASPNDHWCENHFKQTHTREKNGRYVVRLPVNPDESIVLGDTYNSAMQLFLSTEKKLSKQPVLKEKYVSFMQEYEALHHMVKVSDSSIDQGTFYMPHHAVFRNKDSAGKIRVVFNASFRSSSGYSLNDKLFSGPKLQSDIWVILTRWRLFRVAFKTDVVKMFRQIKVHRDDVILQRIIWRENPSAKAEIYNMTTVTYGTAPAPFLAHRVLLQLAADEEHRFPLGARAIRDHSYVDDIFAGADDVQQAVQLRQQTIDIFGSAQFRLDKWAASCPNLVSPSQDEVINLAVGEGLSTLGVIWHPATDSLSVRVSSIPPPSQQTKRSFLMEIARLFDPLGWIAPVIIVAKILLQDLWLEGRDWDHPLTPEISQRWTDFRASLSNLESLQIPRWIATLSSHKHLFQLHGFCDASKRAFAACVYLRAPAENDKTTVHLIVAKSKIAPVKTQTIPRLELCGALLLTRLIKKVQTDMDLLSVPVRNWTDSQVTLAWLNGHASRWPTFVAHRVAEIQDTYPASRWSYVPSCNNPADKATRGLTPVELIHDRSWWHGPDWLQLDAEQWPRPKPIHPADIACHHIAATCDTDLRKATAPASDDIGEGIMSKFSTLTKTIRVIAYCFRLKDSHNRHRGFLRASELNNALMRLVRLSQSTFFAAEIQALELKRALPRSSALLRMNPWLDDEGHLRVGGRLQAANLTNDQKHPLIISKESHLATLLVRSAHAQTLHGGPQATRNAVLQRFWIIHGSSLARKIVRACTRCARFSGRSAQQIMAPLPADRIRTSMPFDVTGVDYAGPIFLRTKRGRGFKVYKGYICLFVCLSTKSLHLEAVTELTSFAFIAAFKRFTSRRGHCSRLMSDNGTTFRGADKELRQLFRAASDFYIESATLLANLGTDWSFIPPYSPHFGGLWEAGVKATKFHLRRVIGAQQLTYEEMSTLLCEIEACLNSRPLTSMSNNPTDLAPLTPGHFLIGRPLTTIPEPGFLADFPPPLIVWQRISKMKCDFWFRWKREYLHQLQARTKWKVQRDTLQPGTLVIIIDDLSPPAKWPLARVIKTHPGPDGHARVATLLTAKGNLTRPIVKLCPLDVHAADGIETKGHSSLPLSVEQTQDIPET